jgi:hypothetical protein
MVDVLCRSFREFNVAVFHLENDPKSYYWKVPIV